MKYNFFETEITNDFKTKYKEKRNCYIEIEQYINNKKKETKVCAIYGLRRTGKTVLMEQCIENMTAEQKTQTAFITCNKQTDLSEIYDFIKENIKKGKKYFFIDEITYANDFQQAGEVLANEFVARNDAKIIITGTDSLGLSLPTHNLQYQRTKLIHTTYITYAEYDKIIKNTTMDDFISKGSVLEPEIFSDYNTTHEYINTSITENLINSLEKSEGIRKYPAQLTEIYEAKELQNAIERIIDKYSQDITVKAIKKEFKSGPISASLKNILKAKENPDNIKPLLYSDELNQELAKKLGIKKNDEISKNITEEHKNQIMNLLEEMDVFTTIPVINSYIIDEEPQRPLRMITHPGICHKNITETLNTLKTNKNWLQEATEEQKTRLINKVKEYAYGNLMENIIIADVYNTICNEKEILPTTIFNKNKDWYVSKITKEINGKEEEADLIIMNKPKKEVYLFEIKHSKEKDDEQEKHLENQEFMNYIENNFGKIVGKAILYNGKNDFTRKTPRINAAKFLKELTNQAIKNNINIKKIISLKSTKIKTISSAKQLQISR